MSSPYFLFKLFLRTVLIFVECVLQKSKINEVFPPDEEIFLRQPIGGAMKSTFTLAVSILVSLGITACSGGSSTGAIPQTVQAGATITQQDLDSVNEAKQKAEQEAIRIKAQAEEQAQKNQDEIANLKAQLADSSQKSQEELQSAQEQLNEQRQKMENSAQAISQLNEENARLKAINYSPTLLNEVEKESVVAALVQGSKAEIECAVAGKNINACIGASNAIEKGSVIYTDQLSYAGYATIRSQIPEGAGYNSEPVNSYVAIAKMATRDKNAVVDATYKGGVSYTNNNLATIIGKQNNGAYIAELTLNVKDQQVSGVIENVNASINEKRISQGVAKELVTLTQTSINLDDGVVGFNGEARFNYGQGFLLNSAGTTVGIGTYQGVFAGENAEEVVGTFSTNDTSSNYSVQGAFLGTRQ